MLLLRQWGEFELTELGTAILPSEMLELNRFE